jgi:hypothetical protein
MNLPAKVPEPPTSAERRLIQNGQTENAAGFQTVFCIIPRRSLFLRGCFIQLWTAGKSAFRFSLTTPIA